ESKAVGHFAVYHVTFRAAWAIFSLTRQDEVIVTAVRSRRTVLVLGMAVSEGRCHQRPDGACGFARRRFPIQTIVLPFITETFLSVFVVLCRVEFFLCRHQLLANTNGRHFIPANAPV